MYVFPFCYSVFYSRDLGREFRKAEGKSLFLPYTFKPLALGAEVFIGTRRRVDSETPSFLQVPREGKDTGSQSGKTPAGDVNMLKRNVRFKVHEMRFKTSL